jgi:hypothetical protein
MKVAKIRPEYDYELMFSNIYNTAVRFPNRKLMG